MRVLIDSVDDLAKDILKRCGVDKESIDILIQTFHYADCRGLVSHGVGRLPLYVSKIKSGNFNPKSEIEIVDDRGSIAVLDAHNGFGQVAAYRAIEIAIDKAGKYGISAVGVRNSNNFGAAGFFGDIAARRGFAAQIFANAAPAIAPTGGNKALLGTNPICMAFPGSKEFEPVVLDMATTVAARGKIRLALKNGEKIPFGWATDENGCDTNDPGEALKGLLLPIGGYKGYGLSLFIDIFAGLMTGSSFGGKVGPLSEMSRPSGNGHLFILIDPSFFLSENETEKRLNELREALRASGETNKVFFPGEQGYQKANFQKSFIELSTKQCREIQDIASKTGSQRKLTYVNE